MSGDEIIQKRPLGQTGIEVTPIGLGGNKFSGGKGIFGQIAPDLSQEQVNDIIKAALDGGMNWIDTAEMYGFGRSERAIAAALRALGVDDDDIVVATKWNPLLRTARNIPHTIDKRCDCLDGYTIDLYMVHNPFGFSSAEDEMKRMSDLVEAGKIRSVGVSNFNVEQMRRAHKALAERELPLAVNQVEYSLLNRKIESNGVLDVAKELGVTIVAWAPLGSGLLTGKYHDEERFKQAPFGRRMMLRRNMDRSRPLIAILQEIADRYNVTPSQIALNWLINFQGETVVAIPGASNVHHAQESADAMRFKLAEEEMARLQELSRDFVE
jgi:aryl-alcohol dehydrogenase-like predicted oxidoreductase